MTHKTKSKDYLKVKKILGCAKKPVIMPTIKYNIKIYIYMNPKRNEK